MKLRTFIGAAAATLPGMLAALADAATAQGAQALSERAATHIKQVGEATAFTDFTRPDGGFSQGELDVF